MIALLFAQAYSLGGSIAACASYCENKSVLWAAIHGIFGWWYLAYRWVTK